MMQAGERLRAIAALQQLQAWVANTPWGSVDTLLRRTLLPAHAAASPHTPRWHAAPAGPPACCQHGLRLHELKKSLLVPTSNNRSLFGMAAPKARQHKQRRLVGWTPEQFYQVVSDVAEYHKFVPWCQRSVITKRGPDGTQLEAELEVGFQLLVERYVSRVRLLPNKRVSSSVASSSMLFHHLDSAWSMEPGPVPRTCWLSFEVDFAFKSVLYNHVADMFFNEVVKRMVGAFEGRCTQLYGPSSLLRLPPHQQHLQQAAKPTSQTTSHTASKPISTTGSHTAKPIASQRSSQPSTQPSSYITNQRSSQPASQPQRATPSVQQADTNSSSSSANRDGAEAPVVLQQKHQ